jgi:hypothetical protein
MSLRSLNRRALVTCALLLGTVMGSAAFPIAAQAADEPSRFPAWDTLIKDATKVEGLFNLYYNEKQQKLFLEIRSEQYDKEFLLPMSIARGAGGILLGGDTLNFGDQWVFSFKRAGDRILVVRKNVYFQAKSGTPQADALRTSYNDSVVLALNVRSEQSGGSKVLVDGAELFMTDLANIGVRPDPNRSTWGKIKGFPNNIGVEVNAVFPLSFGGFFGLFGGSFGPEIPDTRGAQVVIHYGLSALPANNGYQTRKADDRVGHFLSVLKDFSSDQDETAFVRYVTRWNLTKADASADKSPPKEPIIFWIEKSVPREYRPYVKAGILEWNKAFEKIGFIEAIQVRDQQPGDDFDPEDIRYNTFRWITTSSAFAMGPSRTNPMTGQILDADILFDEAMVRYWRQEYLRIAGIPTALERLASGQHQAWMRLHAHETPLLTSIAPQLEGWVRQQGGLDAILARINAPVSESNSAAYHHGHHGPHGKDCCSLGPGMTRQLGLMAAVMAAEGKIVPGGKVPEEFIGQAIKHVTMHEVGHTLGLRHNFKASSILNLTDVNNKQITSQKGLAGSVMDYLPANIAPKGQTQGDYFSQTIGPYDYWAIEYAYKPISGKEEEELGKIASRVAEADLAFGTDEDMFSNPDPRINAYDLGDPLDFAKQRVTVVEEQIKDLADRVVPEGEGWQRAREALSILLSELAQSTSLASQYVGGEFTYRDHRGDPNGRTPYDPIPVAKQREAIQFLSEHILSDKSFVLPPELLKRLAPEYWLYWNSFSMMGGGNEFPVHQQVLGIQRIVLSQFLNPSVLTTLQNIETHSTDPNAVLRVPEVFDSLTKAIWSELPAADQPAPTGKLELSIIRRNLQREHVKRLSQMVLGSGGPSAISFADLMFMSMGSGSTPADARALARLHLTQISDRINRGLQAPEKDPYAEAHLTELKDRIEKVLAAGLELREA